MSEVTEKIRRVRKCLEQEGAAAARFRGVDWFSWITGGGSSVVIFTNETGVAEVLVTRDKCVVMTTSIERARLCEEELPGEFEVLEGPWSDANVFDKMTDEITGRGPVLCDRPTREELIFPPALKELKIHLCAEELERYRTLGRDASEAMTASLLASSPDWSEQRLAGEGARELWSRGIHPTLILVAGAERLPKHRHPFPTPQRIGRRAMMVFCARRSGLYANLTRFISFSNPTVEEEDRFQKVAMLEDIAFQCSRPGNDLGDAYVRLCRGYENLGLGEEVLAQHFGGLTGYLSREAFARPGVTGEAIIPNGAALAWNPTLPGMKIEDTVWTSNKGLEILTADAHWPSIEINGRKRPAIMVM